MFKWILKLTLACLIAVVLCGHNAGADVPGPGRFELYNGCKPIGLAVVANPVGIGIEDFKGSLKLRDNLGKRLKEKSKLFWTVDIPYSRLDSKQISAMTTEFKRYGYFLVEIYRSQPKSLQGTEMDIAFMSFIKPLLDPDLSGKAGYATTWDQTVLGKADNNDLLISKVLKETDRFLREFRKVNKCP